ncbi:MAG: trimethylamine methyltransferase family protein [Thermoplasmata archaeon]|nr:trimethylamine methyltransferase family protein [Thermoplasmata archaeon]
MAVAKLKFLEKDEEELIHSSSLKILEDMGVLIRSPSVLEMLGNAGATVDTKSMIVKIPEEMVNESLDKAPKEFTMGSIDGKHDLKIPARPVPYVGSNGIGTYMIDLATGEKRRTTRKDIADFARLADALEGIDFFWSNVTAYDVPEQIHMVHALWVALQNCTKNYGTLTLSADDAKAQIELAALIAGGKDQLKKKPLFHSLCCVVAPLSFEKGAIEGQVELVKAGIPVISMSMSLGGMSAPVTIAGTIVNANAENLASLVISQTAAPGAPHIYSSESTPINMVTGNIVYESPEAPLIAAATGQMSNRYGLPTLTGSWGVNGNVPGIPLYFTELSAITMTMFTSTDFAAGAGGIEEAKGGSLEQLVIDSYMWENFRAFLRRFEISEKTMALDVIKQVGHGNTFLTHPHTAKNFRKELYFRDKSKLEFEATGSVSMVPKAKKIVKEILKEHTVQPLDDDIIKKGDEIIKNLEMRIAKN